ncbi:MAG: hypothetical protein NVS3B18_09260 [Candidatus Dormibacteria bacterium]
MSLRRLLPTTLLLLLTGACPALARTVPRGFLGVAGISTNAAAVTLPSQVRRMASDGAETLGVTFNWLQAQPYPSLDQVPPDQRGRFRLINGVPTDFEYTDSAVEAAARVGLSVYPTVVLAPIWGAVFPDHTWSPPLAAPYAAYLAALVQRYGPRGTFWPEHPKLKPLPIRAWQVWNEPLGGGRNTGSVFWDDPFQNVLPRYVDLLHASFEAIKRADAGARVIVAGLVGYSWETMQMLYGRGARRYFDAVALHPYTSEPKNAVRIVRYVRQVMNRNGDANKPIYVSEVGYPAVDIGGVRRTEQGLLAQYQAQWLLAALNDLIRNRRTLKIAQVLWYTWLGTDTSESDVFDYSGLTHLAANGTITAKPALRLFYSIAHRVERPGHLP